VIIELLKSKSNTTTNIDGEPCENKKDLSSNANRVLERLNLHSLMLRLTKSSMLDWVDLFMETKLVPLGLAENLNGYKVQ
jgi:hypothetical protein